MINAQEELLEKLKGCDGISCAFLVRTTHEGERTTIVLKLNHSFDDYDRFLKLLNFEYDNSFGGGYLKGTIWFEDDTCMERIITDDDRGEFWWHNMLPYIPFECV